MYKRQGVERTFPVHSPKIERIEVAGRGDVRRAKLYYLRDRVGRSARVRERRFTGREEDVYAEGTMPPPEGEVADMIIAEDVDSGETGGNEVVPEAEGPGAAEAEPVDGDGEPAAEAGPSQEAEPAEEPRA